MVHTLTSSPSCGPCICQGQWVYKANLSLCSNSATSRCRSSVATLASSRSSALSVSRLSRSKVSWSTMERGGVKDQSGTSPLCSRRPNEPVLS